jgi:hypothetical protein
MSEYIIRKVSQKDIPFIAEAIIAAEKGVSGNLSYSLLFNLSESKVKELIISMLEEEIDGCEFSVNSYLITEFEGQPVATVGGWIEGYPDDESSKMLKSNLITTTFPKESIQYLIGKSYVINDILIDREKLTLQLEYGYVIPAHRSKRLLDPMILMLEENAFRIYPELKKAQMQCFKNSVRAIAQLSKIGYQVVKEVAAENNEVLTYLPDRTKLLMEKIII